MRSFVAGALVGACAAMAIVPRVIEAEGKSVLGAGEAGMEDEKQRWSTEAGNKMSANLRRILVKVPKGYGEAVGMSGGDKESVIWFKGEGDVLRNVVLQGGGLYQVEYEN